jgi:nucleoid-associated protein YgaU
MSRYTSNKKVLRLDSGKRYYETLMPRDVILPELPQTYTAKMGDRWDLLAYKFYGSSTFWYKLALANEGVNGSIFIEPGTIIKIPEV